MQMPFSKLTRALAVALIVAALVVPSALANGRPLQIILSYLPNVSNTGTTSAAGIAEVVMAEGEARVEATGLPRLDPPQSYHAWLIKSATNEAYSLGSFNTAYVSGIARLDQVLPEAIPNTGWDLFLITIENDPTPSQPSQQHSIAGRLPDAPTTVQPAQLPNTGGPVPAQPATGFRADWPAVAGLAALILVAGSVGGFVVGRKRPATK
jgi:hypothetical protein